MRQGRIRRRQADRQYQNKGNNTPHTPNIPLSPRGRDRGGNGLHPPRRGGQAYRGWAPEGGQFSSLR